MDLVTLLWSLAVFLASVFSGGIVATTLKPRYRPAVVALGWAGFAAAGFLATWASYSVNLYNDLVGILGLSALVCAAAQVLYAGSASSKLFVGLMASLIANVVTFLFCGTTDTFLGAALGLIRDTPYTVGNILLFMAIKLVAYTVFYLLYRFLLRGHVLGVMDALQGKMTSYLAAPAVSVVGFYVINLITNSAGIMPGSVYFFPLYITVCVIFVLEYIQIFSSVFWSAAAMKNAAELNVASSIQHDMLPCIFPAFPERQEFDIYATMNPAKEVGGDFYDFFLVDDDHLALVIADVSGKGVPAALFMVIAKTLLKNAAQTGMSPREVLEKVNNQLCENNEAEMFVTVWLGVYEISTGKLTAANAGHEYPAIRRRDGSFQLFKDKHGFVLAGMENSRYREYELQLEVGDTLFVYTDGVAEAMDTGHALYGTDRMLAALDQGRDGTPEQLLGCVKADIDRFVGKATQFDDITMLAIQRKGEAAQRLRVKPELDSIEAVCAFLEGILDERGAPPKVISRIDIAVDEVFSNIVRYSGAADVTVECLPQPDGVTIRFLDDGTPYDPTAREDPDISLPLEERDAGGLGIFLVKKTMDRVDYEYAGGRNVLTLFKRWTS